MHISERDVLIVEAGEAPTEVPARSTILWTETAQAHAERSFELGKKGTELLL